MSFKNVLTTVVKVVVLSLVVAIVYAVSSGIFMATAAEYIDPADAGTAMRGIFVVGLVDVLVLSFVVVQSRWRGPALMAGLAVSFYGVQTFMGGIEAAVFLTPLGVYLGSGSTPTIAMPAEMITGLFLTGIPLAVIAAPLTVILFGKARRSNQETIIDRWPHMNVSQWAWKLAAIIVLYELLYFGFGYYVAWKNPAVQQFYQGTDPGSFLAQMRNVATATPLLILFQVIRALLWAGFALPIIGMTKHKPYVGALATACMLSIPMNIGHVIPNPFMPDAVRMAHFVETTTSTFIFGLLVFWLLHRAHTSAADLLAVSRREAPAPA